MSTTLLTNEQLIYWRMRLSVVSEYGQVCGCCGATAYLGGANDSYFSASYGISLFDVPNPPDIETFLNKGGKWDKLDACEHHFETVSLPEIGWSYHIVLQDGEPEPADDDDDY